MSDVWPFVHAERRALADDLALLSEEQWRTPSLCAGWTVEDVVAHVVDTARTSRLRFVAEMVRHRFDFDRQNQRGMERFRGATPAGTLDGLRAAVEPAAHPARAAGHPAGRGDRPRRGRTTPVGPGPRLRHRRGGRRLPVAGAHVARDGRREGVVRGVEPAGDRRGPRPRHRAGGVRTGAGAPAGLLRAPGRRGRSDRAGPGDPRRTDRLNLSSPIVGAMLESLRRDPGDRPRPGAGLVRAAAR
ncbi:maleylpyruvate isomerase family mycothiol-dependent enzyme [Nocardioides convexus]|uniref:maleylpyruvate isomerase family mycothiol-dependent enzyme n=1 Tax=Nocardioides convexus TaxID=2712224 RepID=UPI002418592E|nr:maleylpyruvate isomerase family mycothiol-dependent enzyme [Nocardioides convexus]